MKVKRADLIQQLADEYGYTKKKAANIVDDFTSLIHGKESLFAAVRRAAAAAIVFLCTDSGV